MTLSLLFISFFTFVELNCENLFDCNHDSLKNDYEYLPTSNRHWTPNRYWTKLNNISRELISCGKDSSTMYSLPDAAVLCEVENDSVMRDLSKRSLLRNAGYEYVMTNSPDKRGIDVAFLYLPSSFLLINHVSFRLPQNEKKYPTRDILYVSGKIISGDTLNIYAVHAPSRVGGEWASRPRRMALAETLCLAIDSLKRKSPKAKIIIAGDFNDYVNDSALVRIYQKDIVNISSETKGCNGALGTYRYKGEWGSLDHIMTNMILKDNLVQCNINDTSFLLEEDEHYGGVMPYRTYNGYRYKGGYSDHLPLVAIFQFCY